MRRRFLALPPVQRGLILMWLAGFVGGFMIGVVTTALMTTIVLR